VLAKGNVLSRVGAGPWKLKDVRGSSWGPRTIFMAEGKCETEYTRNSRNVRVYDRFEGEKVLSGGESNPAFARDRRVY
jgi:hypothetical protein